MKQNHSKMRTGMVLGGDLPSACLRICCACQGRAVPLCPSQAASCLTDLPRAEVALVALARVLQMQLSVTPLLTTHLATSAGAAMPCSAPRHCLRSSQCWEHPCLLCSIQRSQGQPGAKSLPAKPSTKTSLLTSLQLLGADGCQLPQLFPFSFTLSMEMDICLFPTCSPSPRDC